MFLTSLVTINKTVLKPESNYNASNILDLQLKSLSDLKTSLQIAQLNPGKAVDKLFVSFREVLESGSGILLIIIMAWIIWMSWKKRIN